MPTRTQFLSLTLLSFFKTDPLYSPKTPGAVLKTKITSFMLSGVSEKHLCPRIPNRSPQVHSDVTGLGHIPNPKQSLSQGVEMHLAPLLPGTRSRVSPWNSATLQTKTEAI